MEKYKPFERSAAIYDIVHAAKDYDGESRSILHSLEPAKRLSHFFPRLLDVGCGTGEFTKRFRESGWNAVGVDSCMAMVVASRKKGVTAVNATQNDLMVRDKVEAVTCLYGSFSYMSLESWQLRNALQSIHSVLRKRGRFAFDVVHTCAAATKLKESQAQQFGDVHRSMTKRFDVAKSIVYHDITYTYQGESWTEQHLMRAFTASELRFALETCGFGVLSISPTFDNDPYCPTNFIDSSTYYLTVVAEAE